MACVGIVGLRRPVWVANPNPLRADKVDMNTNNNPRPPYDDEYPDDGDPSEYRCFCPSRKECDC